MIFSSSVMGLGGGAGLFTAPGAAVFAAAGFGAVDAAAAGLDCAGWAGRRRLRPENGRQENQDSVHRLSLTRYEN